MWADDTREAIEKILGEYYAHVFFETLTNRSQSDSMADRFGRATQLLVEKLESMDETDIDPSFDLMERLATMDKREDQGWAITAVYPTRDGQD